MAEEEWESIPMVSMEMNIDLTLSSGQAFRWVKGEDGEWSGAIGERLYILHHHGNVLQYRVATPTSCPAEDSQTLRHYLRLDCDLASLYTQWSKEDDNFREKASWCQGVRLLRQPALETLVAFICSSNNNISRISGMVTSLCEKYGEYLGAHGGHKFHSFPHLESLIDEVSEAELRLLGFGYRARYVVESMEEVGRRGGEAWLASLQQKPYTEAWAELQQLPGVGAKVADCVCLMGLDHLKAVPVDVHVRRLAQRDYGVGGAGSLTHTVYRTVGDKFREVFGATAGWAQAVLFTAELQRQGRPAAHPASLGGGQRRQRKTAGEEGKGEKRGSSEQAEPQSKRRSLRLKTH